MEIATPNTHNPQAIAAANIRYLYLEIAFASVLGAIITFNSAFAIRLGASNELVALLTSAPALLAAVGSIPSARFLTRRIHHRGWLFGSLFIYRLGYLLIAFMPILFPMNTATWLVFWIVLLNLPVILFTNGWHVLLGDIIPEAERAFVVSRRQILWSVGLIFVSALGGVWLDQVSFPANYELLYGFGFVTVLGSQFFLGRLTMPDKHRHLTNVPRQEAPREPVVMHRPIKRLLVNMIVYQIGLSLPAALYNIYYIRNLKVSDGWIGLSNAAGSIGVILGYFMWERLLRRYSYGWVQRRASLLTWIYPITLCFVTDLNLLLLCNLVVNMMHSGVDLANFNVLLHISRPHERATYISWFNAGINLSTGIAPLIGGFLADTPGILYVMLIAAIVRFVGGLMFNLYRVEPEPTAPT